MASKAEQRAAHKERVRKRKLRETNHALSDADKRIVAEQYFSKVGAPPDVEKHAYVSDDGKEIVGMWVSP